MYEKVSESPANPNSKYLVGGGDIFLVVSSEFPFLDVAINTDAEMIWAKNFPNLWRNSFYLFILWTNRWKH